MITELHIKLCDVEPTVWRKIYIHNESTFHELHKVIQLLFDWWDEFPYQFNIEMNKEKMKIANVPSNHSAQIIDSESIKLKDVLPLLGPIEYVYGSSSNVYKLVINVEQIRNEINEKQKYPICIDAAHELEDVEVQIDNVFRFPFGRQHKVHYSDLVKRINYKFKNNLVQFTISEYKLFSQNVWDELYSLTERYYQEKPWKYISNEQVIAIYDQRVDEYIFCSVLGDNHDLYGLSVYTGFNGLLSLHMSLTQNFDIDQLFQIHSSLLLRFERQTRKQIVSSNSTQSFLQMKNGLISQYTSYQPGYFPWHINEKEAATVILALKEILRLLKRIQSGFIIPNYLTDDTLLLINRDETKGKIIETTISFKQIMKKILPLQNTLSKSELRRLHYMNRKNNLKIEFSLQYVNVPIQRLKGNRPFLPLSSVFVNAKDENIIYHNIYDEQIDYEIVQSELLHMIEILDGIPGEIITDELTYHYLKPLLLHIQLPIRVTDELKVTRHVNETVSKYLTSSTIE